MRIGLDYDGTFTLDPQFWLAFIESAKANGHEVICVTMRFPDEPVDMPIPVIYTSRVAKAFHMAAIGRLPDVWIDDSPHWIYQGAAS